MTARTGKYSILMTFRKIRELWTVYDDLTVSAGHLYASEEFSSFLNVFFVGIPLSRKNEGKQLKIFSVLKRSLQFTPICYWRESSW